MHIQHEFPSRWGRNKFAISRGAASEIYAAENITNGTITSECALFYVKINCYGSS